MSELLHGADSDSSLEIEHGEVQQKRSAALTVSGTAGVLTLLGCIVAVTLVGCTGSSSTPAQHEAAVSASEGTTAAPPTSRSSAKGLLLAKPLKTAKLWQTAQSQDDLLSQQEDAVFISDFPFIGPVVDISRQLDQTIIGFGGAFTEASALVFSKMSSQHQQEFIKGYFGPDGLGYTVGRVPINSCDFSTDSYSFDDVKGDYDLKHFDDGVAHDTETMIPLIAAAQDELKSQGRKLKLLATPWSPPAWMKSNQQMVHSFSPCITQRAKRTWANYITRWVSAYQAKGVPIWALTVQNEPENDAFWEACVMSPEEEADFLGHDLGQAMRTKHPEVLVFGYDHNKDHIEKWTDVLYADKSSEKFLNGIAFHWYAGDAFDAIQRIHHTHPKALLLASEATYERYRWHEGATLATGEWSFGEGYAHDIIGDLNAGSAAWMDWNLLLDENGGPNHANNPCDAAMMADFSKGQLYRHPQYYFLGHFSKFILPGSKHLGVSVAPTRTYKGAVRDYGTCSGEDGLEATAAMRLDGQIVIVILNCGDYIIDFKLRDGLLSSLCRIPPHSIQTYLIKDARTE